MENKIINLVMMDEYELSNLKTRIENEEYRRKQKQDEFFDVVHIDDGCEGAYCKLEKFDDIPAEDLKEYINNTLEDDSQVVFSIIKVTEEDYNENFKRYEWEFNQDSEDINDHTSHPSF